MICASQQIMFIRQATDGATGQVTHKLQCQVMWRPLVLVRPLSAEFGTKEDDRLTVIALPYVGIK